MKSSIYFLFGYAIIIGHPKGDKLEVTQMVLIEGTRIWLEVAGYAGMGFVLLSFLMRRIMWLRILNLVGAILCCIYGFITETYPTAILNAALIVINTLALAQIWISNRRDKNAMASMSNDKDPSLEETKEEEAPSTEE